jgi:hypothetical protein
MSAPRAFEEKPRRSGVLIRPDKPGSYISGMMNLISKALPQLRRAIASEASGKIAWVLMVSLSAIYTAWFVIERGI